MMCAIDRTVSFDIEEAYQCGKHAKVLVVHAHPDDTEIFCAGILKLLKDAGYEIVITTMIAGGMDGINSNEEVKMYNIQIGKLARLQYA